MFLNKIKNWLNTNNSEQNGIKIIAPISGKIIALEDVPDIVFAEKIIGDGLAINPSDNKLVAPCKGIVKKIFETNHAISFETEHGIELFIHIGIDSVDLKGNGFVRKVTENQQVDAGETIIEFDLELLQSKAKSAITPIIISNMHTIKTISKMRGKVVSNESVLMIITK